MLSGSKLFLVCPFSCMESFIHEKYGDNIFFITAMASVFQFQQENDLDFIKDFIKRENVTEIFIVTDTSCRFINSILKKEKGFGTKAENIIQNLLLKNFSKFIQHKSLIEQRKYLATLIIRHQAQEVMKPELFLQQIFENKINLRGLITTKGNNEIIELKF